jgi:hypothetical protein
MSDKNNAGKTSSCDPVIAHPRIPTTHIEKKSLTRLFSRATFNLLTVGRPSVDILSA